jgi:hypothetical protein
MNAAEIQEVYLFTERRPRLPWNDCTRDTPHPTHPPLPWQHSRRDFAEAKRRLEK